MICTPCQRQQHDACVDCPCQHKTAPPPPEPKTPEPEEAA